MLTLRSAAQRGQTRISWLDSRHTFSFAEYHDPAQMGWGPLRVINDDRVAPGAGFPTHGHRNMEILTWVLSGALAHKDSLGNGSVIRPGDIQRMSAGHGIQHSEFNASSNEPVHFLQIWVETATRGIEPSYAQTTIPAEKLASRLALIASADGREGSIDLHQDVRVYAARLLAGQRVEFELPTGRLGYLQVARGAFELNGLALQEGDGARIADEPNLVISCQSDGELLLFDLPS